MTELHDEDHALPEFTPSAGAQPDAQGRRDLALCFVGDSLTVGYGDPVPVTALGKIGTTVMIFVGLGVFAVAIHQFAYYHMRKREEHTEWLVARLGHSEKPDDSAANADIQPETESAKQTARR